MISDQQMATAEHRFPLRTPRTKEAYLFRDFFAKHFGENGSAAETVGWQDSIACSSAVALQWDAAFQGRAVAGIHESAYGAEYATAAQSSGDTASEPNAK